jgi:hypothetical protein
MIKAQREKEKKKMEIRKVSIRDNVYTFVNDCTSNNYGFNHISTLFKGDLEVYKNKVHYINRTWECYTYETSMRGAVNGLIDEKLNRHIARYKEQNGVTRFKKGEKEQVINEFRESDTYKELQELKDAIQQRKFD